MTKHHTYIFRSLTGRQIGVEIWPDGVEVMVRGTSSDIWSPKLELISEEGDPVQFAFEEETDETEDPWAYGLTPLLDEGSEGDE